MAEFMQFNAEQKEAFDQWVSERPPVIQEMIASHPPNRLYRNKQGQRVTLNSYSEDRTVTVAVSAQYNACMFERNVFGVPIDELEECDLPGPDDVVGAVLTEEKDINEFIDVTRPYILAEREKNK